MTHTVVGLFNNRNDAQAAMQELTQNGFTKENVDLSNRRMATDDTSNTTATTTTTATANTSATTGEGIGDSISNFFGSLFGDDSTTASNYTNAAYDADAILTVQVDSDERAREAAEILDRNGAIDVDGRSNSTQYNQQNFAGNTETTGTQQTTDRTAIPVIEEQLQVGKREVERGGARIRSRIIEKPVEASVRLREEHVVVNRRPVDRAVTDADLNNFKEGEIELTEHAEVPVIGKQARVVEEVEVGKNVSEREQTVHDTVRRTDVDVEELNTDNSTDTDTTTNANTRRATS